MSLKASKHVLKSGTSSVFVGGRTGYAPAAWRFDVREDAGGSAPFFHKRKRFGPDRGKYKLFHYISAGGMRQLRRTSMDDIVEDRRRSFLFFLCVAFAFWLVFYFLPSA